MTYGFATLWTLAKFVVHKWGLADVEQFSKRLGDVVSRYHRAELLRSSRNPKES